jgi:hypothetical protein
MSDINTTLMREQTGK